jgi:hypothetical protein
MPDLAGTVIADTLRPFTIIAGGLTVSGTLQDRVVRVTSSGTLDFYYGISIDETSNGYVPFLVRESFAGFSTDVDYRSDFGLGSVAPLSAFRLDDSGGLYDGSEIRFDFADGALGPGQSTWAFFVRTTATAFDESGLAFILGTAGIGGTTTTLSTYQPVPLPAGLWGFAAAIAAAGRGLRRRRRRS